MYNTPNSNLQLSKSDIFLLYMMGFFCVYTKLPNLVIYVMLGVSVFRSIKRENIPWYPHLNTTLCLLLIFIIYNVLSIFWSHVPLQALKSSIPKIIIVLLITSILIQFITYLTRQNILKTYTILFRSFMIASSIITTIILIDLFRNLSSGDVNDLILLKYGFSSSVDIINQPIATISIFMFIFLISLVKKKHWIGILGIPIVWIGIISHSSSQASVLAVCIGVIVTFMAHFWPRFTPKAMITIMISAFIFVVPLAKFNDAHDLPPLPKMIEKKLDDSSYEHRKFIYYTVARVITQAPFFGYGLKTSKYIKELGDNHTVTRPPFTYQTPHNMMLTILVETGYIGALFFLLFFNALIKHIGTYPQYMRPWIFGSLTTLITIFTFSFSIWHSWNLINMSILTILIILQRHRLEEIDHNDNHNIKKLREG